MTTLSYLRRSEGFTLIEMAVVLIIVIILLTLGIRVFNAQLENASLSETRRKQDAIKDALTAYLGKNKRLPCPDILFGSNAAIPVGQGDLQRTPTAVPPSACTSDVGIVPFLDLGLSRDFALDGWENFFTYRVSPAWTVTTFSSFASGTAGVIPVNQGIGSSPRPSALPTGELAVAVIVSHGKNGLGAWALQGTTNVSPVGADELANANHALSGPPPPTYIVRDISDVANATYGTYDDMVYVVKATDLLAPLVKDSTFKTPEGQTNSIAAELSGLLNSYIITNTNAPTATCLGPSGTPCYSAFNIPPCTTSTSCLLMNINGTPAISPALPNTADGWGSTWVYVPCTGIVGNSSSTTPAYVLVSTGRDKTISSATVTTATCSTVFNSPTGDDVVINVLAGTLQQQFISAGKPLSVTKP